LVPRIPLTPGKPAEPVGPRQTIVRYDLSAQPCWTRGAGARPPTAARAVRSGARVERKDGRHVARAEPNDI